MSFAVSSFMGAAVAVKATKISKVRSGARAEQSQFASCMRSRCLTLRRAAEHHHDDGEGGGDEEGRCAGELLVRRHFALGLPLYRGWLRARRRLGRGAPARRVLEASLQRRRRSDARFRPLWRAGGARYRGFPTG